MNRLDCHKTEEKEKVDIIPGEKQEILKTEEKTDRRIGEKEDRIIREIVEETEFIKEK